MAKKKPTTDVQPESPEAPPTSPTENGTPRKTVRTFSVQCGKDERIVVDVVESKHQTKDGEITILSAVCSRTYVKQDGEEGVSYSYRVQHIPLLSHLLGLAHGFIISTRVIEDVPYA